MQAFIFMTSLLAFYLKGKIEVTQQAVKIREPNTILKFIPLGATNETIAIGHIASCDSSFSLNFKVFLAGLICCFIRFWCNYYWHCCCCNNWFNHLFIGGW